MSTVYLDLVDDIDWFTKGCFDLLPAGRKKAIPLSEMPEGMCWGLYSEDAFNLISKNQIDTGGENVAIIIEQE